MPADSSTRPFVCHPLSRHPRSQVPKTVLLARRSGCLPRQNGCRRPWRPASSRSTSTRTASTHSPAPQRAFSSATTKESGSRRRRRRQTRLRPARLGPRGRDRDGGARRRDLQTAGLRRPKLEQVLVGLGEPDAGGRQVGWREPDRMGTAAKIRVHPHTSTAIHFTGAASG